MNNKIKAILALCLASLFGTAHAQVSSLTYTQSGTGGGSIALSWNSFASTHYIKENGVNISQTSGSTKTVNRSAGTYTYMVTSCYTMGEIGCVYSNSVTVTVTAAPPPPVTPPPPLEFTVGSVQQFLALANGKDKTLANLVGDEIRARLQGANLVLDENGLTYSENLPNEQIRSGCSKNISLRNLQVNASLDNASRFAIAMDTLSKPIVATAQLIGTVESSGTVRVRLGFKVFGECIRYLKASVDGSVRTDFVINASMVINLNPSRMLDTPSGQIGIRINPNVKLKGNMELKNTTVTLSNANLSVLGINAFSGPVGNILERYFLNYITGKLTGPLNTVAGQANTYFQTYLTTEEANLNNKLRSIPQEYIIPTPSDLQPQMLGSIVDYALNYFPPADFLNANSTELLYLLLVGDDKGIRNKVATSLACNMTAGTLSQTMSRASQPSLYRATTINDFCGKVESKDWLGNSEPSISGYTGSDYWTLTPPTSFNLSSISPTASNYQPYMQRVNYRSITGINDGMRAVIDYNAYGAAMSACYSAGRGYCANPPNINNYTTYVPIVRGTGTCKLEMRVYKKDVAQTGLKPLLAIHGGGWKYRGGSFYGMESQLSHFTEQGFVVFAPFYRLTGDVDGNIECNKATGADITADIEAALTWVQNNMTGYGVTAGQKVRVFGQSAGAHLAGWLVTHRPGDVQKALMMYPPTDAQDFINNYQAYTNGQAYSADYAYSLNGSGVEFIEGYLSTVPGTPVNLRDVVATSSLVLNNSFPGIVAGSPSSYPPVYMIHGKQDQLVPAIQSVRLCNAYSTGNPASGPATTASTATLQNYTCGSSRLDLLQEAGHALELCVPGLACEGATTLNGALLARQSLAAARAWLAQ